MAQKHWTLQRIALISFLVLLVFYKLSRKGNLPGWVIIIAILIGALGTLAFYALTKRGIFAKK